jgi:hypothetical protein
MGTRRLLTEAAKSLELESELKLVEPHRYQAILERIISARTKLGRDASSALWWWEALCEPVAHLHPPDPVATLRSLISPNESVWFVAEAKSPSKKLGNFWLYESTVEAVCSVLPEVPPFEYYVVSKKLEWLVCENHHGYVIASGEPVVSRLERMRA